MDDKERFVPGKDVKGEILRIDGENYVVRESSGAEVRMHVDSSTEKIKSGLMPKVGEYVRAKVDAKGHAVSFYYGRTCLPLILTSHQSLNLLASRDGTARGEG